MPAKRTDVTVTLEGEVPPVGEGAPRRIHLSVRLEAPEGKEVTSEEVAEAVRSLTGHLRTATETLASEGEAHAGPRPDRPLTELLEAYRPKSAELVDALLWEGELTPTEHQALQGALPSFTTGRARGGAAPVSPARAPSSPPAPAAAPAVRAPTPSGPSSSAGGPKGPARSVDTLLRELDLKDMRDVNRARGRRAISYEEWASLKAHYEPSA